MRSRSSPDRLQRVAGVTDHGDEGLNQGHEPRELVLLAVRREDRLAYKQAGKNLNPRNREIGT